MMKAAYRTMSIGGATYDIFVRTPHNIIQACDGGESFTLPLGAKIRVDQVLETCGGGASNTSVGLSRLGCNASFCGVVGSDQWGQKLLENLQHEKVDTRCATVVDSEVSSFSIILSASSGERVILYEPGTNAHLHDATFDRDAMQHADWVYLNHIQGESCVIQNDIISALGTDNAPRFTWNPGGCQLETGIDSKENCMLISHSTLILLNEKEALAFTKETSVENAIQTMLTFGAKNICVTKGRDGTIASDGTTYYRCPIDTDTTPIDTTGAGDAFGTGATWALLQGYDLQTALKAGTINGASVVGAIGAQTALLTDIEMRAKLESTQLGVEVIPFS